MNTQNDKLDLLATEVLKTAVLRDDELEAIASQNELFYSVRARIIADNVARVDGPATITFFQRTAILTAAAAMVVFSFYGTMLIAKKPDTRPVAAVPAVLPNIDKDPAKVVSTDVPYISSQPFDYPESKPAPVHLVRAMDYRPAAPERRTSLRPQPELEEQQTPRFFALAGLRPSEVAVDGSRIIRVELPRASLVTLGVNVPLDSDKQLIKTDLLVGPDGVPRAIRLVE